MMYGVNVKLVHVLPGQLSDINDSAGYKSGKLLQYVGMRFRRFLIR
jgi:hypothetical protein